MGYVEGGVILGSAPLASCVCTAPAIYTSTHEEGASQLSFPTKRFQCPSRCPFFENDLISGHDWRSLAYRLLYSIRQPHYSRNVFSKCIDWWP